MKLEHLAEGSEFCPLLRLSDFTAEEALRLLAIVQMLASRKSSAVGLNDLPFVAAESNCHLTLRLAAANLGIVEVTGGAFACELSPGGWSDLASLIHPFASGTATHDHFQWLLGGLNTAHSPALLLTPGGQW
jgi:hypothetical protein